jgi:hypothetical protein
LLIVLVVYLLVGHGRFDLCASRRVSSPRHSTP